MVLSVAQEKRGRTNFSCLLPRTNTLRAMSAQIIMPRQVARAAAQMPRSSTTRKVSSIATLRADINMFSSMLPRISPQMRM